MYRCVVILSLLLCGLIYSANAECKDAHKKCGKGKLKCDSKNQKLIEKKCPLKCGMCEEEEPTTTPQPTSSSTAQSTTQLTSSASSTGQSTTQLTSTEITSTEITSTEITSTEITSTEMTSTQITSTEEPCKDTGKCSPNPKKCKKKGYAKKCAKSCEKC